MKVNDIH